MTGGPLRPSTKGRVWLTWTVLPGRSVPYLQAVCGLLGLRAGELNAGTAEIK